MSANSTRLPLAEARRIADNLTDLLRPVCERVALAGSIRREKADIGDVEIVAIPLITHTTITGNSLFGEPVTWDVNRLDMCCSDLLADGTFEKRLNTLGRAAWGTDLKWGLFQDFAIDIYSATVETWAVTLAIRTGPAGFSQRLVTPRSQGGLCPSHLEFKGWRLRRRGTHELLDTPTEESLFEALGIPCPEPTARELAHA